MTKKAFSKIMGGIEDAGAYLAGDKRRGKTHTVNVPETVDVRAIRSQFRLSQARFAARFGFDASALRDWEQGRRQPDRAARILLTVIKKEPEAVERALG